MRTFRYSRHAPDLGVAIALFVLGIAGCDSRSSAPTGRPGETFDASLLVESRLAKDKALREDDSPIPGPLRENFAGLPYYPPNPKLAIPVTLEKFPSADTVSIAASGGETRRMIRHGRFRFSIDGQEHSLTVYKHLDNQTDLFIPFRDATNGRETYKVGRYLDLDEKPGEVDYLLDFNYAYSPYCAYNPAYTCPLVPRENVLTVAIEAGEKTVPDMGH
jgi:uncharacterized protein